MEVDQSNLVNEDVRTLQPFSNGDRSTIINAGIGEGSSGEEAEESAPQRA